MLASLPHLLKQRRPIAHNELDSIGDIAPADPIVSQELSQQLDRALAALRSNNAPLSS